MKVRPIYVAVLALLATAFVMRTAAAADPEVPPGIDPGGEAIVIVGTGIDYRNEVIAARLARDGEGELIGWDFVDNDRRPFADPETLPADKNATELALQILRQYPQARIIPMRLADNEGRILKNEYAASLYSHVLHVPARIVVLSSWRIPDVDWEEFRKMFEVHNGKLFILAPISRDDSSDWPIKVDAPNALTVAPLSQNEFAEGTLQIKNERTDIWADDEKVDRRVRQPMTSALAAVAALATCLEGKTPTSDGRALRKILFDLSRPLEGLSEVRLLEANC